MSTRISGLLDGQENLLTGYWACLNKMINFKLSDLNA